jgi:hypothetical protein
MRLSAACLVLATFIAFTATPGSAEQACEEFPVPCIYEGRPFRLVVVDAETRVPVAGVHVLAEWQTYAGGRRNGPIMVQDGETGPDGSVAFQAWGPIEGPWDGLVAPNDPILTFFKPGYRVLVESNKDPTPRESKARIRRFMRDGETFGIWPFRGIPEQWADELPKAGRVFAAPISDEMRLAFRVPYLNRLYRVRAERDRLPEALRPKRPNLLDRNIEVMEGTSR